MTAYYDMYKTASIYQSVATGGDSTAFIYTSGQSQQGGLLQLRAINQYNQTVYAQVLNAPFPTGVQASGYATPSGVPTGAGSVTGVPSGAPTFLTIGQAPVAVLAVPTGPGQAVLDVNTAHWIPCPNGMIIAASSSPAIYKPINTGCVCFTILYKQ